jgi:hypothetical protein
MTHPYTEQNIKAAHTIMAAAARYAGLPVEWARLVLARAERTITGPLFKRAA